MIIRWSELAGLKYRDCRKNEQRVRHPTRRRHRHQPRPRVLPEYLIRQPQETILVLISDLYEGGDAKEMLKRMTNIVSSGVQVIALLALDDEGAPAFDHNHAAAFASLETLFCLYPKPLPRPDGLGYSAPKHQSRGVHSGSHLRTR